MLIDLGWVHSAFREPAFSDSDQNICEKYSDLKKNPKYIHCSHRVKEKQEMNPKQNKYTQMIKKPLIIKSLF